MQNREDVNELAAHLLRATHRYIVKNRERYPNLTGPSLDTFLIASFGAVMGMSVQRLSEVTDLSAERAEELARIAILAGRVDALTIQAVSGSKRAAEEAERLRVDVEAAIASRHIADDMINKDPHRQGN